MQGTRTPPRNAPTPALAAACRLAAAIGPAAGLGIAAGLGGCAANPEVRAVSARQAGATAEGSTVKVLLELSNPNDAPVELTHWDYSFVVADRTAYSGEWVASLTLPPKSTMQAELPAFLPASFGDASAAQWRVGGSLGYRATGKLDKLLYQLGINRLSAGFGTAAEGISKAPVAKEPATPTAPAPAPASPEPAPASPEPSRGG
jgi:hypothetical protein